MLDAETCGSCSAVLPGLKAGGDSPLPGSLLGLVSTNCNQGRQESVLSLLVALQEIESVERLSTARPVTSQRVLGVIPLMSPGNGQPDSL